MVLEINGVDIIPYVAFGGFKWQRADIDGPNAGRTLDNGYLYRDRVASKVRLDITCRPLTSKETEIVLSAIYPEYITVTYTDPQQGGVVTKEMYSNNNPASHLIHRRDGSEVWGGITFPLIER